MASTPCTFEIKHDDNIKVSVFDVGNVPCEYPAKTENEMLDGLISSEKIIDAISHHELCDCGLVKKPVAMTSSVDKFFEKGYTDIWTYYCCDPCGGGYSNRFISMPSGRNRITGVQLYKYNINGFLHWGYNFYFAEKKIFLKKVL